MKKRKPNEYQFGTKHSWESEDNLSILDSKLVQRYAARHDELCNGGGEWDNNPTIVEDAQPVVVILPEDGDDVGDEDHRAEEQSGTLDNDPTLMDELENDNNVIEEIALDDVEESTTTRNSSSSVPRRGRRPTYVGHRPFKCAECGKEFLTMSDHTKHMRVHNGEKPFQCSYCGRCFSIRSNLKVHVRSHTGEKPFECAACEVSVFFRSVFVHFLLINENFTSCVSNCLILTKSSFSARKISCSR